MTLICLTACESGSGAGGEDVVNEPGIEPARAVYAAIYDLDVEEVASLIEQHPDLVDTPDGFIVAPIGAAFGELVRPRDDLSRRDDAKTIIKMLLDAGANPYVTVSNNNLFTTLVAFEYFDLAEYMIDMGYDINYAGPEIGNLPLVAATSIEGYAFLLKHGADPNLTSDRSGTPPLVRRAWSIVASATTYLREKNYNDELYARSIELHASYVKEGFDILSLLISHGADPALISADGYTAYGLLRQYEGVLPEELAPKTIFESLKPNEE